MFKVFFPTPFIIEISFNKYSNLFILTIQNYYILSFMKINIDELKKKFYIELIIEALKRWIFF